MEAELKKRISENAKLSYWVSSSSKFFVSTRRVAFVVFWLCKFVFRSQPHYVVKPLYISVYPSRLPLGLVCHWLLCSWGIYMFN